MSRVLVQSIWQQKHPTATNRAWEFHWHPRTIPAEVTDAIAAMDVGLGGEAQSAWIVTPAFAVWLRTFSALVPSEQRAYVGLAGVVVRPTEGDFAACLPSALARVTLPPAEHAAASADTTVRTIDAPALLLEPARVPELETARGLAQGLLNGGAVRLASPQDDALPSLFGALLSWLPPGDRTTARRGSFTADAPRAAAGSPAVENLLHYLAQACLRPDAARPTFALVHELCRTLDRSVSSLFEALTALADAWDSASSLATYLRNVLTEDELRACDAAAPSPLLAPSDEDAGMLWNRVLHYWGRGFLRGRELERRLSSVLACRILVDHMVALSDEHASADRYLRRLRYEALLDAKSLQTMTAELARVAPGVLA
jgi:hypothetical protein